MSIQAAGVLTIAMENKSHIWLTLISQENGGKDHGLWGSFGGYVDPGEDPLTAAFRELSEESMGLLTVINGGIYSKEDLEKKSLTVVDMRMHEHPSKWFRLYVVEIAYDPQLPEMFHRRFLDVIKNPNIPKEYKEKSYAAWVPLHNILNSYPLRPSFRSTIKNLFSCCPMLI